MGKKSKSLGLYLHIPFCTQKCNYCDFLSFPTKSELQDRYVDALEKEIIYSKDFFERYKVNTIFVGGGTPSILLEEEVERIFAALYESFDIDKESEITVEVNPNTVTKEKISSWKEVAINRISIGLQSVNSDELRALGRLHTYEQFKKTYFILRESGFSNINIDLISGIPMQSLDSYKNTLNEVIGLSPEHISAYSLIIEEGTKFGAIYEESKGCSSKYGELPSEETDRLMYELTKEMLNQKGYHRYEISNYAKPGYECKHNLGYWERADYLGLGLGAASLIDNRRFNQTSDLSEYINRYNGDEQAMNHNPIFKGNPLSKNEQMEEFIFLGLRKTDGISMKKFQEEFGESIKKAYGKVLTKLANASLIKMEGDMLSLTEKGIDVSNLVFVEFLQ